jgi:hypothetical protein
MAGKRRLTVELLEDRTVPATFGIPWQDPSHLTLSFAPDGTAVAGHQSQLFDALNRQFATADWQRTLLRAFQTWAVHANLNFGLRPDGGQAFGVPGFVQGDPRFGDIRLGAHAMTPEVLAVSVPPDPALAGTWTGDVLLNSAYAFTGNPFSLLTVAMHEAGNALGLADSSNPDAVMHRFYNATRTDLAAEDVARIQALYGVRAADGYEGAGGNETLATASPFRLPEGYKGETPLVAFGDITTQADVDFYSFTSPDDGNDDQNDRSATIRLQTAGASLLAPKLTVLDRDGRVLSQRTSTSVTGDVLQVTVEGLSSRQTYYVKVEAATPDVFGVGRYGLSTRLNKTSSTSDQVIDKLLRGPFDGLGPDAVDAFFRTSGDVLLNPDDFNNETPGTATPLTARPGYAPGTRFEAVASLAKKEDVDVYRLPAPAGAARVLTASVWTADGTGFQPRVAVVDAAGNPVAAEVLVNGNGTSTVQVADTVPGRDYYLRVTVSPQAGQDKGNYFVGAGFGAQTAPLRTFAGGTLGQSDRADSTRLYVAKTQLFHFVLTADDVDPGASVRLRVRDGAGNEVFALTARAGEAVSGSSVLLRPGAHTVHFDIDNPNGRPLAYRLAGGSESDPVGPVPSDSTLAPQYTSPENPGMHISPGFVVPYDPATLPGYVNPNDPSTYPPGFVLPPELAGQPWLVVTGDPFYWIPLDM